MLVVVVVEVEVAVEVVMVAVVVVVVITIGGHNRIEEKEEREKKNGIEEEEETIEWRILYPSCTTSCTPPRFYCFLLLLLLSFTKRTPLVASALAHRFLRFFLLHLKYFMV